MSITAALGRIDQILALQQQVQDPTQTSAAATSTASPSGGASLTGSNSASFASALAMAQADNPAAAAIGDTGASATSALPYGTAGTLPYGTSGTSPYGASGTLPYGATGTAPYGATGTSPLGVSGIAGTGLNTSAANGASDPRVQAMTDQANALVGLPYVWGGGHSGWGPQAGYDCSGFVSKVLHAGGYLSQPADTTSMPNQAGIEAGPGQYVTIYDRAQPGDSGHVIIEINGQFFESGGSSGPWGGGGGVQRIGTPSASYLATFPNVLHPAGL